MSEKKEYVTYGSCCPGTPGAQKDITTCNCMLAPMAGNFEEIILGALKKLDTSHVWTHTDRMGTVYRGRMEDVLDAVMACFAYAYRPDVHMTLEMNLSHGCPGDHDADFVLSEEAKPANEEGLKNVHFPVDCRWELYPLGSDDYMKGIADIVNHSIDLGLYKETGHGGTILHGDVHELFDYFRWVFGQCKANFSHFAMEITMVVNAPD